MHMNFRAQMCPPVLHKLPTHQFYLKLILQGLVLNVVQFDNAVYDGEIMTRPEAPTDHNFSSVDMHQDGIRKVMYEAWISRVHIIPIPLDHGVFVWVMLLQWQIEKSLKENT